LAEPIAETKLSKFGLSDWLSETTLTFDLSMYLDRTLAQRKAKSKVKVTHCVRAGVDLQFCYSALALLWDLFVPIVFK